MTRSRLALRMTIACLIAAWALMLATMTVALSLERALVRHYGNRMPAITQRVLDAGHWLRGDLYPGQRVSGFTWMFPLMIAGTIKTIRWHRRVTGSLGISWRVPLEGDEGSDALPAAPAALAAGTPADQHGATSAVDANSDSAQVVTAARSESAATDRLAPVLIAGLAAAAAMLAMGAALLLHGIAMPFLHILT